MSLDGGGTLVNGSAANLLQGLISGGDGGAGGGTTGGIGGLLDQRAGGTNYGEITGGGATSANHDEQNGDSGGVGLLALDASTLTNAGLISGGQGSNASISGASQGGIGVELSGSSALINTGSIIGGAGGRCIGKDTNTPGAGGVGLLIAQSAGALSNSANIEGGNGGNGYMAGGAGGAGVSLEGGDTLTNTGTISGGIGGYASSANPTGSAGVGGAGVYLDGGVLITSGTINGGSGNLAGPTISASGDAVLFGAAVSTLVVDPGALFNGLVVANASVADALELAGSASASISGLGTDFTGFSTITVEGGANWTLDGTTNTAPATEVLQIGGSLSVEGDLLGAASAMVVGDVELQSGTLQLGKLALAGGVIYCAAQNTFVVGSSLAGATPGAVTIDAGATLSGFGVVAGSVADGGLLAVSGGSLQVNGGLSGTGTISAAANDSLYLNGGGSFAGAISGAGKVFLDAPITFDAGSRLSAGSVLAEANVTLASASLTNTAADRFVLYASSGKTVTLGATGTGAFTNLGTLVAEEPGTAVVSAPFTNDGTISLSSGTLVIKSVLGGTGKALTSSGTVLDLTGGGALSEAISGAGTLQLDSATFSVSGNTITAGTVKLDTGAGLSGHGTLAGKLADAGVLTASGGTLQVDGALSGSGTIAAAVNETLIVAGGGSFAGAVSGAGKVLLDGATTLDAGASLSASSVLAEANVTLASVSVTNTAADRFVLYAGSGKTVTLGATGTGAFTNLGTLVAEEPGTAVVSAPFTNDGTASVTAGTLSFLSGIAGTGKLEIGASSTLSLALGAGSGQVADFLATSGVLDVFKPLDFVGSITGFGGSDEIFLENTVFTTFGYSGDILTVKDGSAIVASLHITESSNSFSLTNENSGVLIKFT